MPTLYKPFRGNYGIVRGFTGSDYRRHHTGVDYRTPMGTPILASAAGAVVRSVDLKYSYGRFIIVAHTDNTFTLYAHLSRRQVAVGARVAAGQQIGLSGSTGNSSGPHLHFEVRKGRNSSGATVNPLPLLRGNPPVALAAAELPEAAADLTATAGPVGLADEPDTAETADVPVADLCGGEDAGEEVTAPAPTP
ncbi:M23 family metallopeptidase [Streptomyces sp. NPDC046909]|uniref:M23 family metallopeptidase n=1 Tax=Streptomyces sp. NPDC046909 TaxID=3155617 RepID=UPI0033FDFC3F